MIRLPERRRRRVVTAYFLLFLIVANGSLPSAQSQAVLTKDTCKQCCAQIKSVGFLKSVADHSDCNSGCGDAQSCNITSSFSCNTGWAFRNGQPSEKATDYSGALVQYMCSYNGQIAEVDTDTVYPVNKPTCRVCCKSVYDLGFFDDEPYAFRDCKRFGCGLQECEPANFLCATGSQFRTGQPSGFKQNNEGVEVGYICLSSGEVEEIASTIEQTNLPSSMPTNSPTLKPSKLPTTASPTNSPTTNPPINQPITTPPTSAPTSAPTSFKENVDTETTGSLKDDEKSTPIMPMSIGIVLAALIALLIVRRSVMAKDPKYKNYHVDDDQFESNPEKFRTTSQAGQWLDDLINSEAEAVRSPGLVTTAINKTKSLIQRTTSRKENESTTEKNLSVDTPLTNDNEQIELEANIKGRQDENEIPKSVSTIRQAMDPRLKRALDLYDKDADSL